MALSAFDDASRPPRASELAAVLGPAYASWKELPRSVAARLGPLSKEWGFTSKSTGWGLRLRRKDRIILYMTPCRGFFLASFALGEAAVRAARESGLPAPVLEVLDAAKKYAEGRGVRLEVRTAGDVRNVVELAVIKAAH